MYNEETQFILSSGVMTDYYSQIQDNPVFCQSNHRGSDRYDQVSTKDVVDRIRDKTGYIVSGWQQAKATKKQGYQAHMVRMRSPETVLSIKGNVPEIVIVNSHDTTKALNIFLGVCRLACLNGLILGNSIDGFRQRHLNFNYEALDNFIANSSDNVNKINDMVTKWQSISTTSEQARAIAYRALQLRGIDDRIASYRDKYPSLTTKPELVEKIIEKSVDRFLQPRRYEDTATDLYTVYNRVQESMTQGVRSRGLSVCGYKPLKAIDSIVSCNRELWDYASTMVS